ncbi:unnamed protein product [Amaranthus hypochondriacus]
MSYIWSGKEGLTKKAAVSWKQMGLPYSKGGLNLRDMYLWNRVAILKQLWNLACNKENLWVKWVHSYYLKTQRIQDLRPSIHASWSFKKIIKQRSLLGQLGGWEKITRGSTFDIGKTYELLIADVPKFHWGNIMIKNAASPSARFITWLAIQDRLATKDKIGKWVDLSDDLCVLCSGARETNHHLFFDCANAKEVRNRLFNFLPRGLDDPNFKTEILQMNKINKKKTDRAKLIVGLWTEMIYCIWMQRNKKVFDTHTFNSEKAVDCIVFRMAGRANSRMLDMLVTK